MELPPCLTTKEAMILCKVKTYNGLNAILGQHGIKAAWRGAEGNVYRGKDFERVFGIDNSRNPFDE